MKIEERKVDNNFTLLRLVLALLVVLGHFKAFDGIFSPNWPFNYAATAVCCFFVVSGYLITDSFDRDSHLIRFYTRRIFRIYPLYLAVITAQTILMGCLVPGGFIHNAKSIAEYFAANAVFANFLKHDVGSGVLNGLVDPSLNASLWTLKIEFAFYLVLPFLWIAVKRYGPSVLAGVFFLSAFYYWAFLHADDYQLAKQLPGQLQFFVLGIAAYKYRDRLVISPKSGLLLAIVSAVLMTVLQRGFPATPLFIYPLVVAVFVVAAALQAPHFKFRTDFSYGVYLLHAPLIQLSLLSGFYRPSLFFLAAIIVSTVLLAAIAERWIERPGIALGKRLAQRPKSSDRAIQTAVSAANPIAKDVTPNFSNARELSGEADRTVVIVNDFCYVQGGASKVAIDEAIGLAQAGTHVVFLGAVGPICPELRAAPMEVVCLDQRELLDVAKHPSVAIQGLWNAKAERRLGDILLSLSRDRTVVHLHGYTKAMTTSPVRIARRLGFTVVCTLHDFFAACPNGAFFDYYESKPCTKRALSPTCITTNCDKRHYIHKLFRVVRSLIQRGHGRFPLSVNHYICLSKRSAAMLKPYLPTRSNLYTLENPMDGDQPPPAKVARNRTLLYVGRLDREKGAEFLADVAEALGLSVTFVGDGPLRSKIEAHPSMTVTGWLDRDAVHKHIAEARCLIFPSLWYETYGLVVAEAAAHGIPTIVSDITAAAERVEDGSTGWRFRSGDPNDLARCLKLVADDDLIAKVGEIAYRKFWEHPPTLQSHTADLLRIYDSALPRGAEDTENVPARILAGAPSSAGAIS